MIISLFPFNLKLSKLKKILFDNTDKSIIKKEDQFIKLYKEIFLFIAKKTQINFIISCVKKSIKILYFIINYLLIKFILCGLKIIFLGAILFIFSCDKKKNIKSKIDLKNLPSKKIYNARIVQKDSGRDRYYLTAPVVEEYGFLNTPVILFPSGVFIQFFNPKLNKKGSLRADYGKVIQLKKYYQAKGNVLVITPYGDTMRSKSFFYFLDKKKILTKDTVKINCLDNSIIYANNGLEICDDLSCYKLFENTNSEVIIKDL